MGYFSIYFHFCYPNSPNDYPIHQKMSITYCVFWHTLTKKPTNLFAIYNTSEHLFRNELEY
jgi:hypothetical protein